MAPQQTSATGEAFVSTERDTTAVQSTVAADMEDHALEPVPADRRKPLVQLIVVQMGWNISVSSFLVGGVVGGGTSFTEGLLAILIGNVLLAVVASLVGMVGFRTGLTSYLTSRAVFGTHGAVVVSLFLGVVAMGFIGVLMDTWGLAVNQLIPEIPKWAFIVAFSGAILTTAIFGFKGLQRYSAIAVPVQVAIALFALVRIGDLDGGFSDVVNYAPAAPIGFSVAIGAVIATWVTGAALVGDVQRYAVSARDVVISSFCGFAVGAAVFELIATVSAMKVGNSNFVVVMQGLGLLALAAVMLFLALWNTADNNIYSASLAFTNASNTLGLKVAKPVWTVFAVLIALLIAFAGLAAEFQRFLGVISVVVPPFAGVLIAYFWVVVRRWDATELLRTAPSVRWEALGCWVAGALIARYTDLIIADAIEGLIAGFALYAVVGTAVSRWRSSEQAAEVRS